MIIVKHFIKIVLILTFITSCGFEAVHNSASKKVKFQELDVNYEDMLASVKIETKRGITEQKLKDDLIEILNPYRVDVAKEYILKIDLGKSISATLISPTGSSGRNKVTLYASYELKKISNKKVIATGSTSTYDDFDVEERRFANYLAEKEIELNLTKLIAKDIRDHLIHDILNPKKEEEEDDYDEESDKDLK